MQLYNYNIVSLLCEYERVLAHLSRCLADGIVMLAMHADQSLDRIACT